jgi:hypothetical protein
MLEARIDTFTGFKVEEAGFTCVDPSKTLMMVKVLGETSSIQGNKEKVLGTFHKTSLLLECTFGLLGHPQEYKFSFFLSS